MTEMKRENREIALTQIFILTISIFAFSYLIGSTDFVSAVTPAEGPTTDSQPTITEPSSTTTPVDPYSHYYLCDETGKAGCVEIPEAAVDPEGKTVDPEKAGEEGTKFLKQVGGAVVTQIVLEVFGWAKEVLFPVDAAGAAVDAVSGAAPVVAGEPFKFSMYFFGNNLNTQSIFFTEIVNTASWWNYAIVTLLYTFGVAAAITAVASLLGASGRNVKNIGIFAFSTATATYIGSLIAAGAGTGPIGWVLSAVVLLVTGGWILLTYKLYSQEVFTFIPSLWQPQKGGEKCEECNKLEYGCSEYQCQTFGKACEYEDGACYATNVGDIIEPTITPIAEILPSDKYSYSPANAVYPTNLGVTILYNGNDVTKTGCIPAFSSLTIGVETNERAECRVDIEDKEEFDGPKGMVSKMTRGTENIYEHYLFLPNSATPSVESLYAVGWNVSAGTQREFYIRCEDVNGNSGHANFIVRFCIDDGPDTSPPNITGTNYQQETFIQSGVQSIDNFKVYTDEPAECRWDYNDIDYEAMAADSFDYCSMNVGDYISGFDYGCEGILNGLKDSVDNKFYIKCEDKPWWVEGDVGARFTNTKPYIQILKGTQPLVISEISVNEQTGDNIIIEDSTNSIKATIEVKTSAGAEQGKARCQYKDHEGTNYNYFYNDGNVNFVYPNSQDLPLTEDTYSYDLICYDAGGNSIEGTISFEIKTDTTAPKVIRAYHESTYLKILTDENAVCVYDVVDCTYDFDEGLEMASTDSISHFASWNTQVNYYIKCKDDFGNWPWPDECSIIVKASKI